MALSLSVIFGGDLTHYLWCPEFILCELGLPYGTIYKLRL